MAPQPCPRSQGSRQRPGPAGCILGHSPGPLCTAATLARHVLCPDIGSKTLPHGQDLCEAHPIAPHSADTLSEAWPRPPQSSLLRHESWRTRGSPSPEPCVPTAPCRAPFGWQEKAPAGSSGSHLPRPPWLAAAAHSEVLTLHSRVVQFPLGFRPSLPSRRATPARRQRPALGATDPRGMQAAQPGLAEPRGLCSASVSLTSPEQHQSSSLRLRGGRGGVPLGQPYCTHSRGIPLTLPPWSRQPCW